MHVPIPFTLFCILAICSPVMAGITRVPFDQATIQEALDGAGPGDTVLVSPGTYTENLVWPATQGIVLLSVGGPSITIIDGTSSGSVISMLTVLDSSTVIEGFTVRQGESERGGGIYCVGASPTIRGNVIEDCFATLYGGGIYCQVSSAVIDDNTIQGDSTGTPLMSTSGIRQLTMGGGICILSSGSGGPVTISNNVITGNYCSYYGAGIASSGNAQVIGNQIMDNQSDWFGGGFYHLNATGTVLSGNLITGNSSNWGGGIMLQGGLLTISGCEISNNDNDGIHIYYGTLVADSSDITGNLTDGIGSGPGKDPASVSVGVHYCNITDNGGFGMRNAHAGSTFNATLNWWGDPSGPGGVGPGTGDEVSMYVDYDPWLTEMGIGEGGGIGVLPVLTLSASPNPFSQMTTITVEGALQPVDLSIYDLYGRLVRSAPAEAGSFGWNGRDESGMEVPDGVYFVVAGIAERNSSIPIVRLSAD